MPAGWDEVQAAVPKAPRRKGAWSTTATVVLRAGGSPQARLSVPVVLWISAAAAKPDVARGGHLTLIVRRGQVEVRVRALAAVDADVGDTLLVKLKPSGKLVRAKLVRHDQAVAVEER